MGYNGYRYRSWRYVNREPSKYKVLAGLFGSVITDIKTIFLSLDADALDELLSDYGSIHGKNAEMYARNTYAKWKKGATRLSGQTMERLVELLPPYLPSEERFRLLEKLLAHHKLPKKHVLVRINIEAPSSGFEQAEQVISSLEHTTMLANLPANVMRAATWLYDDDATSLRAVLAQAERKESELIRANIRRVLELFKRTVLSGQLKSGSYSAQLPTATVEILAYKPSKCFVASVCFGHDSNEATMLRIFRDEELINHSIGRSFIIWYYESGESISKLVSGSKTGIFISRSLIRLICFLIMIKNGASNG